MKVVIVTGAASGIGRAVAADLASDHRVVAVDWNASALRAATPPAAQVLTTADVTDEQQVQDVVDMAVAEFGGVDGLVHCAGIEEPVMPAIDMPAEVFRRTVEVNLYGSFLVCRAVAAHLRSTGRPGSLVLIGSILSQVAWGGNLAYTASKGGVLQLGRGFAVELAGSGIRVNVIGPGIVATPMSQATIDDPQRAPRILERVPIGRFAEPAEVAAVARFLLSDAASYITGTFLPVDGGWLSL
ncbi:SDR family oxidoreductase [Nonomuraea sp. NPDC049750]|uniref:SDR family NAD(P)-dependent oxidoreductase n=1 Tax=Nonomuraea sp. NPDC049750 TaxID=3154738 RepID=UPI003403868E